MTCALPVDGTDVGAIRLPGVTVGAGGRGVSTAVAVADGSVAGSVADGVVVAGDELPPPQATRRTVTATTRAEAGGRSCGRP